MISFFNTILYQPLFNALIFFYNYIPLQDFGIAVILLTVIIKLIFYPLGVKAIRSQKALSDLQPKLKEIQEKYKDDKEKQGKEMMELYKKEKINPFSGCLPMLIQLPVLIALFWVFRTFEGGVTAEELSNLYSFIPTPEVVNTMFLGLIDLIKPNIVIAVLAGLGQFFQTRMTTKRTKTKGKDFQNQMQKQMQYFFPIFTVIILFRLPSAIGLYWLTTTIFTIIQQYFIFRKK